MSKIPFRVIIYILKFHALELNIKDISDPVPYFQISDYKFKISDLFGYFKLDKWKKSFKLFEHLSFDKRYSYLIRSLNFVSIKNKPIIDGCILYQHELWKDEEDINFGCDYVKLFNYICNMTSLKWLHIMDLDLSVHIIRKNRYMKIKPSNIISLKLMYVVCTIDIINFPKLENIYVNCHKPSDSDDTFVNLIGFKNWKGVLKTDTPDKVYIK